MRIAEESYREVGPEEVAARIGAGEELVVLDVRSASEYAACHIPGAVHIPLDALATRCDELDAEAATVVVCEHGIRSAIATQFLRQIGFQHCENMRCGMSDWEGPIEGLMA